MAGNNENIDSIIADPAFKQVSDLKKILAELDIQMASNIKTANELNSVTGGSTSLSAFKKNAEASSQATKTIIENQDKIRVAEIKLQQAREKAFDDYEKKQGKAAAAESARIAKLAKERDVALNKELKQRAQQQAATDKDSAARQKAVDKEIAADQKQLASEARIARQRDKDSAEYIKLIKQRDKALQDARNIGATYGYDGKLFEAAAQRAATYQKQVDGINSKLGSVAETGGNVAGKAFSMVRTLANILPNFGIGTFFLVLGTGIAKVFDIMKGGESTVSMFNKLTETSNNIFAEQATKVSLLKQELDSGNVSQDRQREIIEQLNKISPTYFGNLKDIGDIVKKLPGDFDKYNNALLLNSRIQAGLSLYTEKYKELLESQRKLAEVAEKPADKSFLGTMAADFKSIALFGNKGADIMKNIKKEGADGVFTGGQKLYEGQIKNTQRALNALSKGVISDQKKLQQNGGDIAGEQIAIAERVANSNAEVEKMRLQSIVDINTDISNNDKKSYGERQSALQVATKTQQQILGISLNQELNDISLTNDKKAVLVARYNQDIDKSNIDQQKKAKELRDQSNRDEIQYQNERLDRQKKTAEGKTLDPSANLDDRLNALTEYQKLSREIIKNTERLEIIDAGENYIKIKTAKEKAANDLLDVDNDVSKKRLSIQKEVNALLVAEFKEGIKNQEQIEKNSETVYLQRQSQELQDAQDSADAQLAVLADQYKKGEITQAIYADKKKDIEASLSRQTLAIQIAALDEILRIEKAFGMDTASDEQKLADLKRKLSKETADQQITDAERAANKRKALSEKEKELADAVGEFGITLVNAGFENRKNALEKEKNQIDENSKAQIDAVERSVATEQQKADKISIINAQAQADKAAIDREQKKIDVEKAKFDKAVAIARIIENTAVAITALPAGGGLLGLAAVPLIVSLGAIQLATVLAQPIPQYAKGTKNAKGGLSIVGEEGFEIINEPGGHSYLSKDTASLINLKKGSEVIPHKESVKIMKMNNFNSSSTSDMAVVNAINNNTTTLKKALSGSKKPNVNVYLNADWYGYSQRIGR